jgi:hypothetical protein
MGALSLGHNFTSLCFGYFEDRILLFASLDHNPILGFLL